MSKNRTYREYIRDLIKAKLTEKGLTLKEIAEENKIPVATMTSVVRGYTDKEDVREVIVNTLAFDPWKTFPEPPYIPYYEKTKSA